MISILLVIIYLAFISLGLPDSLLGSAWPTIYREFGAPVSYMGIISMIISIGTVISSLQSDRLTRRFGAGKVTVVSVTMTAVALLGFSVSDSMWMLCLWAIPYGLGAGSVDAALNNYVAVHYASRHMSWLHCMWGLGAIIGPYAISFALTKGYGWHGGYRIIGIFQVVLSAILLFSLPLWKKQAGSEEGSADAQTKSLTINGILKLTGAKEILVMFFCYCAVEQTTMQWASTYLNSQRGIDAKTAAGYASLFFIGITVGRAISGFLTMKFSDAQMIRLGQCLILLGVVCLFLPVGNFAALAGLIIIGLGCAPIYPCVIHSTPAYFGTDKSQAIVGVQMASAYIGTTVAPPLFGLIGNHISMSILPVYILLILAVMVLMHERLIKKMGAKKK